MDHQGSPSFCFLFLLFLFYTGVWFIGNIVIVSGDGKVTQLYLSMDLFSPKLLSQWRFFRADAFTPARKTSSHVTSLFTQGSRVPLRHFVSLQATLTRNVFSCSLCDGRTTKAHHCWYGQPLPSCAQQFCSGPKLVYSTQQEYSQAWT